MKILLIEPSYKNKYPPLGLMKIATYHKSRGDYVYFHKGLYDTDESWDRVYITSLFTFDFDLVVKSVEYYKKIFTDKNKIYLGGIAATLLEEKFRTTTKLDNMLTGRLTNSSQIGFDDNVNIDSLIPDYDILMDTDYKYGTGDSIISYTSRGCINTCSFCAVPLLEGQLTTVNNISSQINTIRDKYGDKRNLLLLDNNILGFDEAYLTKFVTELNQLGYINTPSYYRVTRFEELMGYYYRQLANGCRTLNALKLIEEFLQELLIKTTVSASNKEIIQDILDEAYAASDFFDVMESRYNEIVDISTFHYLRNPLQRYVDFNQGLDARELTPEKMKILARLPIRPYRFAFDNIKSKDEYSKAIRLASDHGVRHFSNYLLYNFKDDPVELYERIMLNLELVEELDLVIYSFPMKYAPIDKTNRKYIGEKWNAHFLRMFQAIINVTKGVVAGDRSFLETAFGHTKEEYIELLHMPHDFIVYRNFYQNIGLTADWKKEFSKLSKSQKEKLIEIISTLKYETDINELKPIIKFYTMRYKQIKEIPNSTAS